MASTGREIHRFVVGVDFGTTYTSVSFAHSSRPKDAQLVQTWPNCSTSKASADQVPTVIHYNPRNGVKKWGYEVVNASSGSADALRWFKLLLQDQSKPTEHYRPSPGAPNSHFNSQFGELTLASESIASTSPKITPAHETAESLKNINKPPVAVVSDFLRLVREVTEKSIETMYGAAVLRGSRLEYVLTIPAIWSNSAKARMVEAAESAGYGSHRTDFNLIGEPESAAVYALREIKANNLKENDTFIVCDAGGGTVDLISYKILQTEPLRLDEVVSGTGDLCGSVYLDDAFEQYIRRVVGDAQIDRMRPRSKHLMMQSWEESVKFSFGNKNEDDEFLVSVPGIQDDEDSNINDSYHTMESSAVQDIFDPFVEKIINLVEQQVVSVQQKRESVAAVLLVGGFGSSQYLLKRLRENYFGWSSTKLQVLQPPDARTAVARGALIRGLDGSIVRNRRSRRCYGSRSSLARPRDNERYWDSKRNTWRVGYSDMESHMTWDSETDTWRARGLLNWYIVKDDVVGENHSVSMDFFRTIPIPADESSFELSTVLYSYEGSDPPEFKWMNPKGGAIKRECILRSDLSSIPRSKFRKTTNARGDSFYEVKYSLRVTLLDEVLKFDRLVNGEVYGQATAKYE